MIKKHLRATLLLTLCWLLGQFVNAQQVMLQGWYWDYPKTGQGYNWSDTLRIKASALGQSGFTHVWYPPFAGNGNKSGGYDPKDLFIGPAQTSLGTLGEIKSMVSAFQSVGITPVADMVYNHRDAGAPENNPAVKDYITKFASGNNPSCGFKRPFPSDRYRMVIPIGGSAAEGAGTYYIKMRSRANIFNGAKYVFHVTTNKIGGSRWSPVVVSEVNLTTSPDQFQYNVQLGRNYQNRIDGNGDVDEFAVTLTAGDFNPAGDFLIIQAINFESEYSDHLPIDIFYVPAGGSNSYNIADYTNPFSDNYKLRFETYTDFSQMLSKRGQLNWEAFRPHFTSSSPAGWSQTTCLGPQFSMQSLDYFYDYDHNIPAARDTLIAWTKWAYDELGSKGLRMDAVKHFEPSFVSTMLNEMNSSGRNPNMVVGEWYGDNPDELKGWVDAVSSGLNSATRSAVPVKVFDFSLRRALKEAIDNGGNARQVFFSSLRDARGMSGFNVVTFLNNHDFRSANQSFGDALIHSHPMLGYAYILTNNQLGVPAVFYPDYYGYPTRNTKFGTDTYGFDYHPTGLSPMKADIDRLLKVLKTYINNSPGVHYLNHYGGTGNNPPSPNNYIEGSHNRCLIYQLDAPGGSSKEVVVAINFGDTRLRVDHQVSLRNGITQGTRFTDILGKSAFPFAVVDGQNRIYIDLPPKSYSVWVKDVAPLSATFATTAGNNTVCAGKTGTLTANVTGGTAPYTYVFSPGVSQSGTDNQGTISTGGTYTVTITDALGLTTTATVTVTEKAATAIASEPASESAVCAGTPVSVSVQATGSGTLAYQWYKNSKDQPITGQNSPTFNLPAAQLSNAGTYFCVVMGDCGDVTSKSFRLTVDETPAVPVLTSSSASVCTPASLTVTSSCPTKTTWSVQGGTGVVNSIGTATNNLYILSAPGTYTLTATCETQAGCVSQPSIPLTVTVNQSPSATLSVGNGGMLTCSQPSLMLTAGGGSSYELTGPGLNQSGNASTATVSQPGTYTVTVTAANGCTATAQAIVQKQVTAPPTITKISGPASPQLVNTSAMLNATLTGDEIAAGTWKWQWGDGTSSEGSTSNPSLEIDHTYTTQGVYTPTLTITDACGRTATLVYEYVVIYNPEGGFVTGGGWIDSPKGAYKPSLELSGKANFGFVAKYAKGTTTPKGNTEFQFKAGNLNFKSTAYDDMRLVIAGSRANFKGIGTINGAGNYGFMLSAIDGQLTNNGGPDRFRIKIWDKATDQVVYDNNIGQNNQGENADPETAISGGSIVIHSDGKNARTGASLEPVLNADAIVLRNYPNPVDGKTTIEFMLPLGGDFALDIQDLNGSLVRHLQTGKAQAGQINKVVWETGQTPAGMYISRLSTQQGVKVLRLLVK